MNKGGGRRRSSKTQSHKAPSPQTSRSSMSEAESTKKRNKLDYTRTSMACAHCRRRKIRCVPHENDTNAKCGNCVRFNKECMFFPVDQQQAIGAQRPSTSSAGQQSSSAASSPIDIKPDDSSYGEYGNLTSSVPSSHGGVLQGYNTGTAGSGLIIDTSDALHPAIRGGPQWQYQSAFQQEYNNISPHSQYRQQQQQQHFPAYLSPVSSGDFSPYPIYSSTNPQYNIASLAPYTKQDQAAMQHALAPSRPDQSWPSFSSADTPYPQGCLYPPTTTTTPFTQSTFADPTYYSSTSDGTHTGEADTWYSSYGSEEHYDTSPDAKPYGGGCAH